MVFLLTRSEQASAFIFVAELAYVPNPLTFFCDNSSLLGVQSFYIVTQQGVLSNQLERLCEDHQRQLDRVSTVDNS